MEKAWRRGEAGADLLVLVCTYSTSGVNGTATQDETDAGTMINSDDSSQLGQLDHGLVAQKPGGWIYSHPAAARPDSAVGLYSISCTSFPIIPAVPIFLIAQTANSPIRPQIETEAARACL